MPRAKKRAPRKAVHEMTGADLLAIRERLGKTQSEMAELVGLRIRRIQQLEKSDVIDGPVVVAARLLDAVAGKRVGRQFGV